MVGSHDAAATRSSERSPPSARDPRDRRRARRDRPDVVRRRCSRGTRPGRTRCGVSSGRGRCSPTIGRCSNTTARCRHDDRPLDLTGSGQRRRPDRAVSVRPPGHQDAVPRCRRGALPSFVDACQCGACHRRRRRVRGSAGTCRAAARRETSTKRRSLARQPTLARLAVFQQGARARRRAAFAGHRRRACHAARVSPHRESLGGRADDVKPALGRLRALGLTLVVVSNANGRLRHLFDRLGLTRVLRRRARLARMGGGEAGSASVSDRARAVRSVVAAHRSRRRPVSHRRRRAPAMPDCVRACCSTRPTCIPMSTAAGSTTWLSSSTRSSCRGKFWLPTGSTRPPALRATSGTPLE